ncbi:hypothetical protein BCR33DRAFT_224494 [Rhizoclosmatium globosum]|uniref:G-protein coupled receptors family 3 profile domain-containing protein n=1 Tax=Rhizoclosmatium globosum TaxID=329046 RepID=A0A1Y2CDY2_9FUNG|nr:hypothetical protein BCR33DRAFT_224494 [Rhizoclosmatium globosum]|eukprot:ORY44515.1 hypothetical protein BCR33DRAFT_224494 [Rhizoclosmatium globosum]
MGMIVPTPDFQLMSDPDFVSILNTWQSVYHANPLKYQTDSLSWAVTGSYDCVGTMLYGIDKFLKSNTGVSPQMLPQTHRLNLTSFANSGFHATALSPMILDSNGDVAANTVFLALNSSFWMEGSQPYFAAVDKFTGNLTLKAGPIFFGGATTPPSDGPPIVDIVLFYSTGNNRQGQVIISLTALGYLVSVIALVFLGICRKEKAVKTLNLEHTFISIVGGLIMVTSMIFYLERSTVDNCNTRGWLEDIGFTIMVIPIAAKNIMVYNVFKARKSIKDLIIRLKWSLYGLIVVAVLIHFGILAYWTKNSEFSLRNTSVSGNFLVVECTRQRNSGQTDIALLRGFKYIQAVSLVIVAVLVHDVQQQYNESSGMISVAVVLVATMLVSQSAAVSIDTGMIRCICIFFSAISVPLIIVGPKAIDVWVSLEVAQRLLASTHKTKSLVKPNSKNNSVSDISADNTTQSNLLKQTPMQSVRIAKTTIIAKRVPPTQFESIVSRFAVCYRSGKSWISVWPEWQTAFSVVVFTLNKRLWLQFRVGEDFLCLICLETTTFTSFEGKVYIDTPSNTSTRFPGQQFKCEFADEKEATKFLLELKTKIAHIRENDTNEPDKSYNELLRKKGTI